MTKQRPIKQNKFDSKGRNVVERATGKVVHKAPTKAAASAVARRMHGYVVWPDGTRSN